MNARVAGVRHDSFVERHGWLRVRGNRITNRHGHPVVLRGVSLFWSQWMPQFYDAETIEWLHRDWHVNAVRASMAVHQGGYLEHPATELQKVETVIRAAIGCGIYVIIDWHTHDLELAAAKEFFALLAEKYRDYPNLIFEPWNEPDRKYDWDRDVRPYHERIIEEIRSFDAQRLVVAGTERFCQHALKAATRPVGDANTAYAFHFYAASHRIKLRATIREALDSGIALLASEFGTCEATGSGRFDRAETTAWLAFLEENHTGYLNWSIADKAETAAALRKGASPSGGWTDDELTESGRFVRNHLIAMNRRHQEIRIADPAQRVSGPGNSSLAPSS